VPYSNDPPFWRYYRRFLRLAGQELALVLLLWMVMVQAGSEPKQTIVADGMGYYDYLKSWSIDHDFDRRTCDTIPERLKTAAGYVPFEGGVINKYPVGTALLESPFFLYALSKASANEQAPVGNEAPFQQAIAYAGLFYLFWGLVFFRKLLESYSVPRVWSFVAQGLALLATPLIYYSTVEPSFSHVYSFFSITAFLVFARRYLIQPRFDHLMGMALFLGLTVLIRQVNILVVAVLPFLTGAPGTLGEAFRQLIRKPLQTLAAALVFGAMVSIQCWMWYRQTGHWVVYSYQGESFDFAHPQWLNFMVSFRKGWLLYTPLAAGAFIAVLDNMRHREMRFQGLSWMGFMLLLTYVFSSWWAWEYGASFGSRVMVDFTTLVVLPLILWIRTQGRVLQSIGLLLAFACVPLNAIQAWQYQNYILHWDAMTREGYFKVFLKTEDRYKGLLFKRDFDLSTRTLLRNYTFPTAAQAPEQFAVLSIIPVSDDSVAMQCRWIYLKLEPEVSDHDKGFLDIHLSYRNEDRHPYWHRLPLLHLNWPTEHLKKAGEYILELPPFPTDAPLDLHITRNTASDAHAAGKLTVALYGEMH
jgi:hypothetical protein